MTGHSPTRYFVMTIFGGCQRRPVAGLSQYGPKYDKQKANKNQQQNHAKKHGEEK
jgi:hypothetical protein